MGTLVLTAQKVSELNRLN